MQLNGYIPNKTPKKSKKWVPILIAGILVLLCGAMVYVYEMKKENGDFSAEYKLSKNRFLNHISINGVDISNLTYNEAWDAVSEKISEWYESWYLSVSCNGFTYTTLDYAAAGIQPDYEAVDAALQEAWKIGHDGDYASYLSAQNALDEAPYAAFVTEKTTDSSQIDYVLNVILNDVYVLPQDALLLNFDGLNAADPFTYQAEVTGHTIDIEEAKKQIISRASVGESGNYDIPLFDIEPDVTLEDLKNQTALIATGITAIDRASTEDRNANIALAMSRISGTVLEDGQKFSFNKIVGKREEKNGFKTALGYVFGNLTEVVGGGVCQASSTMYCAALCAGMTINKRTAHSTPVSYIFLGQDATVNDMKGHEIDFSFTNETGSTVYITAELTTNSNNRLQCVARFYGTKPENDGYYKLESKEIETIPIPEDEIRKDKEGKYVKYTNEKKKVSAGSEGHVVETYLQYYENGVQVSSTLISTDTYKARAAVYYVGVTQKDKK